MPESISARIHPTDQMSIAYYVYIMIGGDELRRHRRRTHLCVLFKGQHDFWCTIPTCGDIFGHEAGFGAAWLRGLNRPCETKVTYFEVAICVEEQIGRFQVTVDDICRVKCLECTQGLIYKVLCVVIREILCSDDSVHVGFHKFLYN